VGRLHARSWIAYPLHVIGCSVGFFVAAYTGSLLTATNQPVWSDSAWIGSLFLCSAASTGLATLVLLVPRRLRSATWERLRRAEIWLLSIELLVFLVFVASLGSLSRLLLTTTSGRVLLIGTLSLGLLFPLAMHATVRGARRPLVVTVAACVLLGGFAMRWGILSLPRDVLASPAVAGAAAVDELTHFGPESGRARGGGAGADPQNHPSPVQPRSKVLLTP
jgi:formate-dependent nitrite reductase membrane component NrfD